MVSEKTGGENISPFRRSVGGGSAKLGGFGVESASESLSESRMDDGMEISETSRSQRS